MIAFYLEGKADAPKFLSRLASGRTLVKPSPRKIRSPEEGIHNLSIDGSFSRTSRA